MKNKIYILGLMSIIYLIPIYINIYYLNFQTDPFIPTTVMISKLLNEFGSMYGSIKYLSQICNNYTSCPWWIGHTMDFITYEPLSGLFVYMISSITSISQIKVAYLPVPYVAYVLFISLFLRYIYKTTTCYFNIDTYKLKLFIIAVLLCSLYSYFGLYVVGKFYVLEYHGIYLVYILIVYYLFFKILSNNNSKISKSKFAVILLIVFLSNLFTHYNFPLTFIGGMIIFILLCLSLQLFSIINMDRNEIKLLINFTLISLVLLLTFQEFYYIRLSYAGTWVFKFISLIDVLRSRMQSPGVAISAVYPLANYWILFKKLWHMLFILITAFLFPLTIYYCKKKEVSCSPFLFAYILILGRDIVWIYSYFTQYTYSLSLELKDAWILNALLLFQVLLFRTSGNNFWKKIGTILSTGLLISSTVLLSWAIFEVHIHLSGDGPFPYQVKEDGRELYSFVISHVENPMLISGSLQSTSGLYEHLYYYDLKKLNKIHPIPAIVYMSTNKNKQHRALRDIYKLLKEDISIFILTEYETKKGFYGGLSVAPLNKDEITLFKYILEINENVIYTSKKAQLYCLK